MTVSAKDWQAYIRKLSALNEKAASEMKDYVLRKGFADMDELLDVAYGLATKYGEGSAALSAQMYDAVAELSGKLIEPAVPAETASYHEVAKTVQGVAKTSQNPESIGNAVGRLVKRAGADTTLKNALRDGAEFAWIPNGDTCAFCITLASRGWQRASKAAIKGGHAEHIHNNCDCTYGIRFDHDTNVAGYDPDKYKAMYDAAEGDTSDEKINSMRRAHYAEHKDEINAQKRAAYARNRRLHYGKQNEFATDRGTINAKRVDRYGYNNIYVDDDVSLSERELRTIDGQIGSAKEVLGITNTCDASVVITNLGEILASYNPRTNTLLINTSMANENDVRRLQQGFTCPDDVRSTAVHELFHWIDADEYRKTFGPITDASATSDYTVYQREKAKKILEDLGININETRNISNYSYVSALDNDWEEVYTEYRTKGVLS